MSELKFNKTRTISYVRKVSTLTGEVFWEPLWDLSQAPTGCHNCVKFGTPHCVSEAPPAWFGACCANWLPKDVRFEEVNKIVTRCVNDLLAYSNSVWAPGYADPVVGLSCRIADLLIYYLEHPLSDFRRDSFTAEDKRRRQYYGYLKKK